MTRDELHQLNKSELIQLIAEMWELPAHRGMSKEALVKLLWGGRGETSNPFDKERKTIVRFLKKNWDSIQSQLDLKCTANCYECNDMQVLACYRSSENVLKGE